MLVYNIRPQAMARLRLSYDDVRAVNPRIIYVGAFGYSQRGPYAAKAAYDDLIQGAAGLPWLREAGRRRAPRYVPVIIADRSVGLHVVNAVCAALYRREKTGQRPARGRADVREPAADRCWASTWAATPTSRRHGAARLRAHAGEGAPALRDQGRLRLRAGLQRQAMAAFSS